MVTYREKNSPTDQPRWPHFKRDSVANAWVTAANTASFLSLFASLYDKGNMENVRVEDARWWELVQIFSFVISFHLFYIFLFHKESEVVTLIILLKNYKLITTSVISKSFEKSIKYGLNT